MKKLSKLLAAVVGISTLLFASCSNSYGDDASGNVAKGTTGNVSNVADYAIEFKTPDGANIDLTTFGLSAEKSASRSIVSTLGTINGLHFYLWGTNTIKNESFDPEEVTFTVDTTDTSKGIVTLDLEAASYYLVLAATKDAQASGATAATIKGNAMYIGYANVDLRNTESIKFFINSDGLTGNGTATLTVVYDGLDTASGTWTTEHKDAVSDTDKYQITAGIFTRSAGTAVSGAATTPGNIANDAFFGTGAPYTATTAPGTYNFSVTFKNKTTSKEYVWSDIIIILPNQEVTATVKVPDVIEYAPKKPTDLKVGYVVPASDDIGTYNVVITWTDASSNEKYFTLDVADVSTLMTTTITGSSGVTTYRPDDYVVDEALWTSTVTPLSASYIKTYGKDFYGNSTAGWVAGSLLKNNKHAVLKLSLGHRYLMRIAAVNDAGTSDYAYATYDNNETYTVSTDNADDYAQGAYTCVEFTHTEFDSTTNDYKKSATFCNTANLLRLTYHLNGGSLTLKSGDTAITSDTKVYYLSQNLTQTNAGTYDGIPIFCAGAEEDTSTTPSTLSFTYPQLVNASGNHWTSWRNGATTGDMYAPSTAKTVIKFTYYEPGVYDGFRNLDLYASYSVSSASVEAYLDKNYDFIDGEVKLVTGTAVAAVNSHSYKVKTGTDQVTVNYAYNNAATTTRTASVAYTSLTATVVTSNGITVANGDFNSSNNFVFKTTSLETGKYLIKVIGEYNGHQYSYTLAMEITDDIS